MSNQAPIIDYVRAPVQVDRLEIRREGDTLVVLIPPPKVLQLVWPILSDVSWLALVAIGLALWVLTRMSGGSAVLFLAVVTLDWAFLSVQTVVRVVRVVTQRNRASVVRASPSWFSVDCRTARSPCTADWRACEVVDVSVRQAGMIPGLARYIRLQLDLTGDRRRILFIPWTGKGALLAIEDNLRDALRRNLSS